MYLSADQIYIPAGEVIANIWLFPPLISQHRVSATFAPNFFLARLPQTLDDLSARNDSLDLSCLKRINSGGEANVVQTAARLTKALRHFRLGRASSVLALAWQRPARALSTAEIVRGTTFEEAMNSRRLAKPSNVFK
jgi:hypothetical protein